MKTTILIIALIAMAMAQDEEDSGVKTLLQWPQNKDTHAGAIVAFAYLDVGEGSCIVQLPSMVTLFHAMNAHIIPGDNSSPAEGRYQVTAAAEWEAANGTNAHNVNVLILFDRDAIFNISDITFTCDPESVEDLSVYSFPQNILQKEASSNVYYRPGFHQFTTMDSEYEVSAEGNTYTLSGFKNEVGIDDMKEVHFSLEYLPSEDGSNWFSASDVTVSVQKVESVDEEE